MPRTQVLIGTRTGPAFPDTADGVEYFVSGITERGDIVGAIELHSMADYADLCGARTAYGTVYDALRCYFEEGGTHAYVARTTGPAAAVGNRVLVDRAGAPLNTLRIDAKDPGAWSANVTVQVQAGSVAGTFALVIRYAGTGGPLVETYDNLATPAAAVAALATSAYVRAVDLASATAAPNNQPAILAATALSAGTDDRAAVVGATYTAALARFGKDLGAGCVAIPGQASATIGAALMAHGAANRRLALMGAAQGATDAAAIAEAQALRPNGGSEGAGLFHPWVIVPDDAGGVRTVGPTGYVAGVRARAIRGDGPYQVPGADFAAARFVVGVASAVDDAAGDTLDAGEVNAIRTIAGRVELYGWRSLSLDEPNYFLLKDKDTLNVISQQIERMLGRYVFSKIDGGGRLFARVAGEAKGIVAPYADRGGLYAMHNAAGDLIDPGYVVDTGPAVNTPATIAANQLRVAIGVRVSPSAAMLIAIITKAGIGATL